MAHISYVGSSHLVFCILHILIRLLHYFYSNLVFPHHDNTTYKASYVGFVFHGRHAFRRYSTCKSHAQHIHTMYTSHTHHMRITCISHALYPHSDTYIFSHVMQCANHPVLTMVGYCSPRSQQRHREISE